MPVFEVYKYGGSDGDDLFKQENVEAETPDGAFYAFSGTDPDTKYLLLDTVANKYTKFETDADEVEVRTFEPPTEPTPVQEPEPDESQVAEDLDPDTGQEEVEAEPTNSKTQDPQKPASEIKDKE